MFRFSDFGHQSRFVRLLSVVNLIAPLVNGHLPLLPLPSTAASCRGIVSSTLFPIVSYLFCIYKNYLEQSGHKPRRINSIDSVLKLESSEACWPISAGSVTSISTSLPHLLQTA